VSSAPGCRGRGSSPQSSASTIDACQVHAAQLAHQIQTPDQTWSGNQRVGVVIKPLVSGKVSSSAEQSVSVVTVHNRNQAAGGLTPLQRQITAQPFSRVCPQVPIYAAARSVRRAKPKPEHHLHLSQAQASVYRAQPPRTGRGQGLGTTRAARMGAAVVCSCNKGDGCDPQSQHQSSCQLHTAKSASGRTGRRVT
jgi:hypothetical protein